MPQYIGKGGNLPPAQKLQPLFLCDNFKHFLCLIAAELLLWEEEHSYAVLSLPADFDAQRFTDSGEKFMWNLCQDAHAVAGLTLCVFPRPVFQILNDFQGILHRGTALLSVDIDTGADPAVIMLKGFPVKGRLRNFSLHIKHIICSFL